MNDSTTPPLSEEGEGVRPKKSGPSFQELIANSMEICPGCSSEIGPGSCCMTYTIWHCFGCGADLDSRVVTPRLVQRCQNTWPDYRPIFGETEHPLGCSCTGRGWYDESRA